VRSGPGRRAAIGSLGDIRAIIAGTRGTQVTADAEMTTR